MKWTRRDTTYLSVILLLGAVLVALLLEEEIGRAIAPVAPDNAQRPFKVEGGTFHPSPEGGGVVIDGKPELHRVTPDVVDRQQSRIIEITPGMTRSELAEALGVSPDDLPPSEEIGVMDD